MGLEAHLRILALLLLLLLRTISPCAGSEDGIFTGLEVGRGHCEDEFVARERWGDGHVVEGLGNRAIKGVQNMLFVGIFWGGRGGMVVS